MLDTYCIPRKPWRFLSLIITVAIIIGFLTPTTVSAGLSLAAPVPIYPPNFAYTTSLSDPPIGVPSFSWSSVPGATSYKLQVDNEIGFNNPLTWETVTPNLSYTPTNKANYFADGPYFWRVRVETPSPVSEWSSTMQFTKSWATPANKPSLISPVDSAHLAFFDYPVFLWTPVMGAAKYRIQIASDVNFSQLIPGIPDTLTTTFQPNRKLANGTYFWRVIPIDAMDHLGTISDVRSFIASYGTNVMSMVPTQIRPEDESFPTLTPTFHWTAVEGAEHYRLEYTSAENCNFSQGVAVETRQTFYTPTETFPNDFRYCWRVRVESESAVGDWSFTWHFQKRWNLKPVLLTPTDLSQTVLYPLYSWTPVPGAARYLIQISRNDSFSPIFEEVTTSNTTYAPQNAFVSPSHYWWRVRPIDGSGKYGVLSDVSEYQAEYTSIAPIQISPLYYYQPNNYPGFPMNPYEDRTVAFPIFQWHRVLNPAPLGGTLAVAYRIQVDDSPYFDSPIWEYDTENTSATPVLDDDFNPSVGQDYFWHVCPLNFLGGDCLEQVPGLPWWSQTWKARFNNSLQLTSTSEATPELMRPAIGQESVEATPMLEWWPFTAATQYQVEVSREPSFSTHEISETVDIPAYSPVESLAQRSLGRTNYGTFYWRVRGLTGSVWSGWSDTWRFQIASQSEWRFVRPSGSADNKLKIGQDPAGDAASLYDLTTLYSSQANSYWYLGFDATISTTNRTYVFYLDLDNVEGSGANAPPIERNYAVSTVPEHQPEFAIYVDDIGGVINSSHIWVFAWNDNSWGYGQRFVDIGASVSVSSGYVELKIPNGAIGMTQDTSSASVMLFSVKVADGTIQDTAPSDPTVPGSAILSRFSTVSERMNLIYPANTATGDPSTITSMLPFFWDWPTGSYPSTPWSGSILQVDIDQDYTPPHEATFQINSNTSYFSENNVSLLYDIVGDNIYYWRVQPRYSQTGYPDAYGAWAYGWSFHRVGFTPQNLHTSITFATPTFSWDMAEGAETYNLQVATDPNFGQGAMTFDINTSMNSYTRSDTLPQGLFYWRVRIIRGGNIGGPWSQVQQFTMSLPVPTGLSPNNEVVSTTPTFCWDPLVGYDQNEPVFTAWKYHVYVSADPGFSRQYDQEYVYNNCWTSAAAYDDGTYYWHVALIDGNGREGYYSPTASFTKQYPMTTLISPISGSVGSTPTFKWNPVHGAATYYIEVSLYPTFFPTIDNLDTINTQFTPLKIYESDKTYYWRVAIRDYFGKLGPFNNATIIISKGYIFLPTLKQ